MANCIYCGRSAGWFRHQHKACVQKYDMTWNRLLGFFSEVLKKPIEPRRFGTLTQQIAADGFINGENFHALVQQGLARVINQSIQDNILTQNEEDRISDLMDSFSINIGGLSYEDAGKRFAKAIILRQLNEGHLPKSLPTFTGHNLNLVANEVLIWAFQGSTFLAPRSRTQYVGSSHGVSIRVMKGVYYRTSAFRGEPIKTQYLSNEGIGNLLISNFAVYFLSPIKTVKLPIKKIISVEPYPDGIAISREGVNAKTAFFQVDDPWFAVNSIILLNRVSPMR